MIDRKAFRKNYEQMQIALARRNSTLVEEGSAWGRARALDFQQRDLKSRLEQLLSERNSVSKVIGQKKAKGDDCSAEMLFMANVSKEVKAIESDAKEAETLFADILMEIPNPPHDSVPFGLSEEDNVELRRWGQPRTDEVPAHWDIGESLGILDFEAGVRLAGSRFSVLRGMGARLERALMQFMLDMHSDQHGYEEVWVPALANRKTMTGTGQLPKFEEDLYRIADEDLFLIPTAEVPVTNLYQDMILNLDRLPIRHCAYTPCFRKEAGSAGRDVRGMIRQHQFDKVELVQLVHPDQALTALAELTSHAEAILQALELPYRVVDLCTADIGFSSQKTVDLEVWLPSQKVYREISSCSSFGQFQGQRAGIRYRNELGKPDAVATLNGSGLAIGRTLVALLENGWQTDGSVLIPTSLHQYLGGRERIYPFNQ
ncbi:MAG: serine--tRNA ligase [Zetaproteobacteria bacterium]|nr:serine--tRNA ligase [Zetaproteobacteria bacterium]